MAFKDILVHVDNFAASAARLRSAIKLAETNDARLTGLYVLSMPYLPAYAGVQISAKILEAQADEAKRVAETMGETFAAATKSSDIQTDWRVVEGVAPTVLSEQARYFDLTVVGQSNPDDSLFPGDRDMPDRMILSCGRPVLVIPYVGDYETIGENVMVAWDASAMATRAVHDALPILQAAKTVTVMVVNPKDGDNDTGELPGADISAHLVRHGVNAEPDHMQSDLDPGNRLLSWAADKGADLIVMGAYGHARWTEMVHGPVTNHLLAHMTVPTLMSH